MEEQAKKERVKAEERSGPDREVEKELQTVRPGRMRLLAPGSHRPAPVRIVSAARTGGPGSSSGTGGASDLFHLV